MLKQYSSKSIFIAVWDELAEDWRKFCNEVDLWVALVPNIVRFVASRGMSGEGRGKSLGTVFCFGGEIEGKVHLEELGLDEDLY